ncbi:Crp/Fnr family transcriptional regulator [Adhaeribacter aquaticus]|uniref:Crp/Fnr family transcriptional regulator n=1 Tax=Adhaeribacter aquaticus TaxID=299567 RepID=UPI0004265403|nr:Crp/Fnr family transcriptional regulator [Adhaeribacter aquaticus]
MDPYVKTAETEALLRKELIAFISRFELFTQEEVQMLVDNLTIRLYKKGTLLVQEGDICHKCYFVIKGCLRQYLILNGVDKTTQFYTENQAAVFFTSFSNLVPTESYLSCVEDSIIIVGDQEEGEDMYERIPKLGQLTRMMMAQDFGKTQDELSYFISSSPEERYLNLLKTKPALLQRVPQHQLASYIGVSPESLSRIRKRIWKDK